MYVPSDKLSKVFRLYLEISRYPLLGKNIREEMRKTLFARRVIDEAAFEAEVKDKAIQSQAREGLRYPFSEESARDWNERLATIRDQLTDFYFAYNLPHAQFQQIIQEVLSQRFPEPDLPRLTFNPELAPFDLLFLEGKRYENMVPDEQHHLREIKAVLIKAMISDHLHFIGLARELFTIKDLELIRRNRIGRGKIGGKATGMLIAWKIIQKHGADFDIPVEQISIPDSYYIGSDVVYEFYEINNLHEYMNQKYKSQAEIVSEYPVIRQKYLNARLPDYVVSRLEELLEIVGNRPLILRSSSLLEDSETAFAGKYDSYFVPNQGTLKENLKATIQAVLKIYYSVLSPDALIYRQRMNLIDFDERMAILIQPVMGEKYGRYFFPLLAGVGYSRNPFRWSPQIRHEEGLLRLVCGLGTRAVDRVANDYPQMISLSHPHLRPERNPRRIRRYSQHNIDVIDIEDNAFVTLPITDVIDANHPHLRVLASQLRDGFMQPFMMRPMNVKPEEIVFTLDNLVKKTDFASIMRNILACLDAYFKYPADIEYAVDIERSEDRKESFHINLLQCRPLSEHEDAGHIRIPKVDPEDIIFSANHLVPHGVVQNIDYLVFVKPTYLELQTDHERHEIARAVGRINQQLEGKRFILMGPGRWGSSNIQLGVKTTYADIYNCLALIEVAVSNPDSITTPEMSYGTHFFQDLVESRIYPLALFPDEDDIIFNWEFFEHAPNLLPELLPDDAELADVITVIDIPALTNGQRLCLIMDSHADEALGFLCDEHDSDI